MYFLENIKSFVDNNPEKTVAISSNCTKGMTYRDFDDYTSRIYNYLKSNDIGKEDFVLICLPRGVRVISSVFGILKAGAAFSIVESNYAPERIEYIKKDINAKLVIDEDTYFKMMEYEPLDGYEVSNPHDACFAIYTSGSTGNPKGVLHEYGKFDEIVECSEKTDGIEDIKCAIISPLNFLASIRLIFGCVYYGREIHIVSYDVVKNPLSFVKYIDDNDIKVTFSTPSFMKVWPYYPKSLKKIYVGGELISKIYNDKIELVNTYSTSEAAYSISSFKIDKEYDVTPVGKTRSKNRIFVVDENDNELPKGEKGEVCIENIYTRGYINLPDKTKETFKDGIYHVGDLGYFNENDDLVICGRLDDMIKINGNRVEPAEIETTIKRILNVNNCVVKGFFEDTRSFIAAYLLKQELINNNLLNENGELKQGQDMLRKDLSLYLPYYMIPTYIEVIEEFPKNANGKTVRKLFPKPNIKNEEINFVKPENEDEEYFCNLFAKILNIPRVSADGDFYLLGGDSLNAMQLLAESKYESMTISDLYQARTPRKLVEILNTKKSLDIGDNEERNKKALEHLQPLISDAQWIFEAQLMFAKGTMWNLTIFDELNKDVDIDRLKKAIDRVLSLKPGFCTHLVFDDDSNIRMKYDPSFYHETEIIHLSQKAFDTTKDSFVQRFKLIDSNLYRNCIYVTEVRAYLFIDMFHIISDGTSIRIMCSQIAKAYDDENYVPETDYFYLLARNVAKKSATEEYEKLRNEYRASTLAYLKADETEALTYVKPDKALVNVGGKTVDKILDISKSSLSSSSPYKRYGGNVFFLYVLLKTQAEYNNNHRAATCWVHNGRDEKIALNANGLLYHSYPTYIDFAKFKSDEEGLEYLKEDTGSKIASGYRDYAMDNMYMFDKSSYYLYQNDIFINAFGEKLVKGEVELKPTGDWSAAFELLILDNSNSDNIGLEINFSYGLYTDEAIDKFIDLYFKNVKELI